MKCVVIVGVGLIGGSIGGCLRANRLCERVIGVGRQREKLSDAQHQGLIDEHSTDLAAVAPLADLVVVCTPVEQIAPFVIEALTLSDERCIVTDGGSTKQQIVTDIAAALANQPNQLSRFVGSHPLAGGEKSGHQFAQANLFQNRLVVMTPTEATAAHTTSQTENFWRSMGSQVLHQTPAEHDRALASISHLPHLVASILSAATPTEHLTLAGQGWSDTTRVAAGDVELWRQIFRQNQPSVLQSIAQFERMLAACKQALSDNHDETLIRILQQGKTNRDALGN